ncbi:MAG: SulP family inorganic anion transporter, partial [Bacteroidota bacterium]|nr:SulP family inorganic anion transporter [Bacteroidota bacterium]
MGAITPGAVVIASVCLGILLLWETKWIKRVKVLSQVPGPLLAVIAGIVLGSVQNIMGAQGLATEHYVDLPDLSAGLAAIQLPSWSAITDLRVWTAALT